MAGSRRVLDFLPEVSVAFVQLGNHTINNSLRINIKNNCLFARALNTLEKCRNKVSQSSTPGQDRNDFVTFHGRAELMQASHTAANGNNGVAGPNQMNITPYIVHAGEINIVKFLERQTITLNVGSVRTGGRKPDTNTTVLMRAVSSILRQTGCCTCQQDMTPLGDLCAQVVCQFVRVFNSLALCSARYANLVFTHALQYKAAYG